MFKKKRPGAGIAVVAFLAVAAAGVAGLAFVTQSQQDSDVAAPQTSGVQHYPAAGSTIRMLFVDTTDDERVSPPSGPLYASFMKGTMPSHRMMAIVQSDSNCAADAEGVSHCLNVLHLANGSVLTVRHNHRMMDVPCLSPGEHVLVSPV